MRFAESALWRCVRYFVAVTVAVGSAEQWFGSENGSGVASAATPRASFVTPRSATNKSISWRPVQRSNTAFSLDALLSSSPVGVKGRWMSPTTKYSRRPFSASVLFGRMGNSERREDNFFDDEDNIDEEDDYITFGGDDDAYDVDDVRSRLEAMVSGSGFQSGKGDGLFRQQQQQQKQQQQEQQQEQEESTLKSASNQRRGPSNTRYSPAPPASAPTGLQHDDEKYIESLNLPPPPPLTSIGRERRLAEVQLLAQLVHGDDTVQDLWALWFNERGPAAATKLMQAEDYMVMAQQEEQKQGMQGEDGTAKDIVSAYQLKSEMILRELIQEHGVYWVEPINRLATLYYIQQKYDDAAKLCLIVLHVKPWHFGALSGIVMVYAARRRADKAKHWASMRLPSFAPVGTNKRRQEWVHRAVHNAKQFLRSSEQDLATSYFGTPDDRTADATKNIDETDADSWQ